MISNQYPRMECLEIQMALSYAAENNIQPDTSLSLIHILGYIEEAMKLRDELAAATGYDKISQESTSQSSASRGFGTEMTHEDAGELSGRFTALQIAGEEIKNQNIIQMCIRDRIMGDQYPEQVGRTGKQYASVGVTIIQLRSLPPIMEQSLDLVIMSCVTQ